MLDGSWLPGDALQSQAESLANSFMLRYAGELWPGLKDRKIQEGFDKEEQMCWMFFRLLQIPLDVPENELVRQLVSGGRTVDGRRVVSAEERLVNSAVVSRPQTLEERVAELEEADRQREELLQQSDADVGLDSAGEDDGFESDGSGGGRWRCRLCKKPCGGISELSDHYNKDCAALQEAERESMEEKSLEETSREEKPMEEKSMNNMLAQLLLKGEDVDVDQKVMRWEGADTRAADQNAKEGSAEAAAKDEVEEGCDRGEGHVEDQAGDEKQTRKSKMKQSKLNR
jgi:hypothetical protein